MSGIVTSLITGVLGLGNRMTLGQFETLPDPALSWMWTLDIINVRGLGQNITNLYVHDVNMPLPGFDPTQTFRAGMYENFPKLAAIGSMMVSFYETCDFQISNLLNKWHLLVRAQDGQNTGNFGLPTNYMGTAVLRLYDTMGITQLEVTASAVWPLRRSGFDMHYQASSNLVVGCEFAINTVNLSGGSILGKLVAPLSAVGGLIPMAQGDMGKYGAYNAARMMVPAVGGVASTVGSSIASIFR